MKIVSVPKNCKIYIDTNIFIYAIAMHPVFGRQCRGFLKKVESGYVTGVSSVLTLNELLHKLILGEISTKHEIPITQTIRFIKKNPNALKTLDAYHILNKIEGMSGLSLVLLTCPMFTQARAYMEEFCPDVKRCDPCQHLQIEWNPADRNE
jgi:predicted nucleic acid-binding protein